MSSSEYQELKSQMDRIEQLLARLAGEPLRAEAAAVLPIPPQPITPGMSEKERIEAVQAEGVWIHETQGFEAYKKFWQLQAKKSRKPRLKRAA